MARDGKVRQQAPRQCSGVTFFQLRESFEGYVSKILGNPSPRQPDTRPATPLPAIPPLHASATQSSARCFLLPHNLTRLIPESIARNPACLAYAQDVQQSVLNGRVLGGRPPRRKNASAGNRAIGPRASGHRGTAPNAELFCQPRQCCHDEGTENPTGQLVDIEVVPGG